MALVIACAALAAAALVAVAVGVETRTTSIWYPNSKVHARRARRRVIVVFCAWGVIFGWGIFADVLAEGAWVQAAMITSFLTVIVALVWRQLP